MKLVAQALSYSRNQQQLFNNLELELLAGQGLLVYGANGSGKTSLLRILAGLMTATAGELTWDGKTLAESTYYHAELHYLGHANGLKTKLSVKENLLYAQKLAGRGSEKDLAKALEFFQLSQQQDCFAQQLSAGQKRRLALMRLIAVPKRLWILDEPFANLDQASQALFTELLEQHLSAGGMAVLASHQALQFQQKHLLKVLQLALQDARVGCYV